MADIMNAAEYDRYGPATELHVRTVARPRPQHGEALVRVQASSVNPIDIIIRSGKLRFRTGKHFPKRTGIDFAGDVVAIGPGVPNLQVGERVWGVMPLDVERGVGQGSAAGYVSIAADRVSASPSHLGFIEAAAVSSAGAVAIITLRDKAGLQAGERLLVRGAAGGVGCMAIQFGRLLGAHVTALASSDDLGFLRDLGAHEAYDYRSTDLSSLQPFDVVLDLVGTSLHRVRRLLSPTGRMYCLAIKGFSSILYIFASRIYGPKRVRFFNASPMRNTMTDLASLVDVGSLRPVVHSIYALEKITDAHRSIEVGGGRGKRVLRHSHL